VNPATNLPDNCFSLEVLKMSTRIAKHGVSVTLVLARSAAGIAEAAARELRASRFRRLTPSC